MSRGLVVGSLVAGLLSDIPIYADERYAFIHDMAVVDAARRQGIGRTLVRYAADWARTLGVRQLRLMAAEPNAPAVRLFQTLGFRTTYHEMVLPLAQER
ncbi:MAG: GNAT family N-acetyltransferase [Phycisphaerales bacterium]|nr:GNAT family N-acetyltransferase [Phycisphaerales bacterium]